MLLIIPQQLWCMIIHLHLLHQILWNWNTHHTKFSHFSNIFHRNLSVSSISAALGFTSFSVKSSYSFVLQILVLWLMHEIRLFLPPYLLLADYLFFFKRNAVIRFFFDLSCESSVYLTELSLYLWYIVILSIYSWFT